MDLVRSDLLPPVIIRDLYREAKQRAIIAQAAPQRGRSRLGLVVRLGAALIMAGCRVQTAGLRLPAASPFAAPVPCGCGALTVRYTTLERR